MTKSGYRSKKQWRLNGDVIEIIAPLKAIKPTNFTSAEWNALTPSPGMIGYDRSIYRLHTFIDLVPKDFLLVDPVPTASVDEAPAISVIGVNDINITATEPQNIADFTNGTDGQIIRILFIDGNTTIVDGDVISLSGGANKNFAANDMLVLQRRNGNWYQIGGVI